MTKRFEIDFTDETQLETWTQETVAASLPFATDVEYVSDGPSGWPAVKLTVADADVEKLRAWYDETMDLDEFIEVFQIAA